MQLRLSISIGLNMEGNLSSQSSNGFLVKINGRVKSNIKEELFHSFKWKGKYNDPLEKYCGQHHNAYVSLVDC